MRTITNKGSIFDIRRNTAWNPRKALDTVSRNAGQCDVNSVLSTAVGQRTLLDLVSSLFFFALMHIRACGHPTLLVHASLCVIFLNPIRCWDRRNEITLEFRIASTCFFSFESTACGTYGSSFFTTHQTEQHSSPGSNGWR